MDRWGITLGVIVKTGGVPVMTERRSGFGKRAWRCPGITSASSASSFSVLRLPGIPRTLPGSLVRMTSVCYSRLLSLKLLGISSTSAVLHNMNRATIVSFLPGILDMLSQS